MRVLQPDITTHGAVVRPRSKFTEQLEAGDDSLEEGGEVAGVGAPESDVTGVGRLHLTHDQTGQARGEFDASSLSWTRYQPRGAV